MHKLSKHIVSFLAKDEIEENALKQLETTSKIPFLFKHIAVMPDCHCGMGSTVGSVIPTKNAIMPSAVGVDIGCGMIAVKTSLTASQLPENLEKLRDGIDRRIPMSAGGYNNKLTDSAEKRVTELQSFHRSSDLNHLTSKWTLQLGSLGSGNHFIEICLDESQQVWVVLHSGSRGIGNKIAQKHINVAKQLMKDMYITLEDPDLAYLPDRIPEFQEYIDDLLWAQKFALLNREEMMDRVMTELSYQMYGENGHQEELEVERINCHHNFTQMENHFGQNIWITRKGAIQMRKGQLGIIPGSMGTETYIVKGLENPMSFHSAPHGAGRVMSRTQARKTFTADDLKASMGSKVYKHGAEFVDEIPAAYKPIQKVIENSKELVEVVHRLDQIVNLKGH